MTPRRASDDRGALAAAELPFGVLFVGVAAIIAFTFPTWVERTSAARAAADEAARAMVTAETWSSGTARAEAVVDEVAVNYGLNPDDLDLEISGEWGRGGEITATVTVTVPAATLPGVGHIGALPRSASHTERLDAFRSLE